MRSQQSSRSRNPEPPSLPTQVPRLACVDVFYHASTALQVSFQTEPSSTMSPRALLVVFTQAVRDEESDPQLCPLVLDNLGLMEVETPIMSMLAGGATAKPKPFSDEFDFEIKGRGQWPLC